MFEGDVDVYLPSIAYSAKRTVRAVNDSFCYALMSSAETNSEWARAQPYKSAEKGIVLKIATSWPW